MLLEHKKAVIYGAGGAIGSAVARAFAHEGADLFLAGRTRARVESIADEISAAGGVAEAAEVDALDEDAIEKHMDDVVAWVQRIDVLFNGSPTSLAVRSSRSALPTWSPGWWWAGPGRARCRSASRPPSGSPSG
jgi:NADP-dependent 3-hydroxy acid dehydrogenase YdfG